MLSCFINYFFRVCDQSSFINDSYFRQKSATDTRIFFAFLQNYSVTLNFLFHDICKKKKKKKKKKTRKNN